MSSRRKFKWEIFAIMLLQLGATAAFARTIEATPHALEAASRSKLEESLSGYQVFRLPLDRVAQQIRTGELELVLGERRFDLKTETVDIFSDDFRWVFETEAGPVEIERGPLSNFNATLAGEPEALIRLSSRAHSFGGFIRTHDQWLFIDALAEFVPGAPQDLVVVYRDLDVVPDPSRACGTEQLDDAVAEMAGRLEVAGRVHDDASPPPAEGGLPIAEFSLEIDGKYFEFYGGQGTRERIVDFMSDVVGIFEDDLDIALRFGYGHVWTDAGTDPYTSQCAIETLEEFVLYWSANEPLYDVMHMFSGKSFDLGIIGVAFLGGVCCENGECPPGAYGLSQDLAGRSDRKTLAAHEIGHNFNALHDDEFPTNCPGVECGSFGPIMCSFLQTFGSQKFSSCSQDDIGDWVAANNSCLD